MCTDGCRAKRGGSVQERAAESSPSGAGRGAKRPGSTCHALEREEEMNSTRADFLSLSGLALITRITLTPGHYSYRFYS